MCPDCTIISNQVRNACSEDCMNNLNNIDEASILMITKAKNTYKANIMFCRFLGTVFILLGGLPIILGSDFLFFTYFMGLSGFAFIAGGQIYAKALK